MSLLEAAPVPSRVLGLLLTALSLQRDRGEELTRERLEAFVAPPSIRKEDALTPTFNKCIDLGILIRDGNSLYVAPSIESNNCSSREEWAAVLRRYICERIAQNEEAEARFCRVLAWCLMQPGSHLPLSKTPAEKIWTSQDPDREVLALNDVRFVSFMHWARFLGFAWLSSLDNSMAIQPDPTATLQRLIPAWTQGAADRRLPVSEFLRRVQLQCPWMESGSVAQETRARLAAPPTKPEGTLNDTTALALGRMEKKGQIRLQRLSDASSPVTLAWGGPQRVVSHIEWSALP